nr:PREDICTED: uncharacterized protein LOC107079278 [Lepisosteus oculatus]
METYQQGRDGNGNKETYSYCFKVLDLLNSINLTRAHQRPDVHLSTKDTVCDETRSEYRDKYALPEKILNLSEFRSRLLPSKQFQKENYTLPITIFKEVKKDKKAFPIMHKDFGLLNGGDMSTLFLTHIAIGKNLIQSESLSSAQEMFHMRDVSCQMLSHEPRSRKLRSEMLQSHILPPVHVDSGNFTRDLQEIYCMCSSPHQDSMGVNGVKYFEDLRDLQCKLFKGVLKETERAKHITKEEKKKSVEPSFKRRETKSRCMEFAAPLISRNDVYYSTYKHH